MTGGYPNFMWVPSNYRRKNFFKNSGFSDLVIEGLKDGSGLERDIQGI